MILKVWNSFSLIILRSGKAYAYKTCLTTPPIICVSVPCKGIEMSYICMLGGIDFPTVSTIDHFDFGIVRTVWYFFISLYHTFLVVCIPITTSTDLHCISQVIFLIVINVNIILIRHCVI